MEKCIRMLCVVTVNSGIPLCIGCNTKIRDERMEIMSEILHMY